MCTWLINVFILARHLLQLSRLTFVWGLSWTNLEKELSSLICTIFDFHQHVITFCHLIRTLILNYNRTVYYTQLTYTTIILKNSTNIYVTIDAFEMIKLFVALTNKTIHSVDTILQYECMWNIRSGFSMG